MRLWSISITGASSADVAMETNSRQTACVDKHHVMPTKSQKLVQWDEFCQYFNVKNELFSFDIVDDKSHYESHKL